jgi:hypothetical protein
MRNTLDDANGRTFVPSEAEGAQFARLKEQFDHQSDNGATRRSFPAASSRSFATSP